MQHERSVDRAPLKLAAALGRRRADPTCGLARATDPRAAHVNEAGAAPRTIAITTKGQRGLIRFELSPGDAAELMFQIGYALERAAAFEAGRSDLG